MISLPILNSNEMYIVNPSKIIAIGLNYAEHVKESLTFDSKKMDLPKEPVIFNKTPNVLIGPNENIILPAILRDMENPRTDYEAELAVILGKDAKNVSEAEALDYVFGVTAFNDVSQRNIQKSDASGWFRGKSLDTFGPIGPQVVMLQDIDDVQNLDIECRLNGKTVQKGNTSDMLFTVSEVLSYISKYISLKTGDIIVTGTPPGIGPLGHGDVVEVEIEKIGILRNKVVQE